MEFFIWVSKLYGVEVKVHFFGADKMPTVQSTRFFLQQAFPNTTFVYHNHDVLHILFHQYGRINSCHHPSYNHFAMLISFPSCPSGNSLLNDVVAAALATEVPWWKKSTVASDNKKEQKAIKKKSGKSKVDRKSHQPLITSSYLTRMCTAAKKALELDEHLKQAQSMTLEQAKEQKIEMDELDLPVRWYRNQEAAKDASTNAVVVKPRSVTPHQCHCSWFPLSFIIFMCLHPCIGCKDVGYTSTLTGVKKNTLIGWLLKPNLISCWLPTVATIKASDIVSALPGEYKDIFMDIVDGTSQVCLKKKANIAKKAKGTQIKITFTGMEVSSSVHHVLHFVFVSMTYLNSFSIMTQ